MDHDVQSAPHRLLQDLRNAIKDLIAHINIPGNQVRTRQLYLFSECVHNLFSKTDFD